MMDGRRGGQYAISEGPMPSISIITPTYFGPHCRLKEVFDELRPQLGDDDEVIVVGDGPCPRAEKLVSKQDSRFVYHQGPMTRCVGNRQRDWAIQMATREWLHFVDDDSWVTPWAIESIKRSIVESPSRPHTFSLVQLPMGTTMGPVGRDDRNCGGGAIGGAQFVPPNNKDKLGKWSEPVDCNGPGGGGDMGFIDQTMKHYPQGAMYHDISLVGYVIQWPQGPLVNMQIDMRIKEHREIWANVPWLCNGQEANRA